MRLGRRIGLVIPALNEMASVGAVVRSVPSWVDQVVVVDNGSVDGTGGIARAAGAAVVHETRRGYGRACLAGAGAVRDCDIVVFADADLSDDLTDMDRVIAPLLARQAELVVGSRVLGRPEKGALTPQQKFGNWLACLLIRWRWGIRFTDLGPFRAVSRSALEQLGMTDTNYGWTAEMQVKAVCLGLRATEVPVACRRRMGRSKISGTLRGGLAAGTKILWVIFKGALMPARRRPVHREPPGPRPAKPASGGN